MSKHTELNGAHNGRAYGTTNRYVNIVIWLLVLFFTTLFTLLFIMCFIHFLKQAHGQIVSREFDNPEATKTIYFLLSFYFFLWMLLYLGGSIFTLVRGQSLSVLQRPGKIILYLLFTILAIITALLCVLDRLYHAWIWSFLNGIIFLYCVQASATITSIVAICSCVCSVDWCFPCRWLKSFRRRYGGAGGGGGSGGNTSTAVVTFLCSHRRNGSNSSSSTNVNSTPAHQHQHLKSSRTVVTASNVNYSEHRTSIASEGYDDDNGSCCGAIITNLNHTTNNANEDNASGGDKGTTSVNKNVISDRDLSRPATSYNNPCYLLAVSTTDENGIPTVILEKEGDSVTQV